MKNSSVACIALVAPLVACQPAAPEEKGEAGTNATLIGTYAYNGGSHSFTPCGSSFVQPLVPGEAQDELIALFERTGGPVVLRIEAHTLTAEAAEGEGTDEYLAVDRLIGEAKCP